MNLDYQHAQVMQGILPLLLGAGALAGKLIGGFFGHKADEKKAAAAKAADDERFNNQKANWDAGQVQRSDKLNAVQGLLQRTQPFLKSGVGAAGGTGPDYTFDPAVLQSLQKPQPFAGSHSPDPSAGLGPGALAGGFGSLADLLLSAAGQSGSGGAASGLGGVSGPISGSALGSDAYQEWLKSQGRG